MMSKQRFTYKTKFDSVVGSLEFSVYFGLAVVSIIASLGFTFVSIEEQSLQFVKVQEASNFEINQLVKEVEANNQQIRIIQENASNLDFSAVERNAEANKQIAEIQERNRSLIKDIEALRSTGTQEQARLTSADMFELLGNPVGLTGKQTMLYMMFALVLLLEIALAITSGSIVSDNILKENKYEINAYIDELFNVKGRRLKTDDKISEITKIPISNCKRYRDLLLNSHYNNIPLIETGKGGTKGNFTASQIQKIVAMQSNAEIRRRKR